MDIAALNADLKRDMARRGFSRINDGPSRMGGIYGKIERDDPSRPGYVIVRLTNGEANFVRRDEVTT